MHSIVDAEPVGWRLSPPVKLDFGVWCLSSCAGPKKTLLSEVEKMANLR